MSWESVKIGELFYDKSGELCKKYSKRKYDYEPRITTECYFNRIADSEFDFGSFYNKPKKQEYVTVWFNPIGDTRVLKIYRTREAALKRALQEKNNGRVGHVAVLTIDVVEE